MLGTRGNLHTPGCYVYWLLCLILILTGCGLRVYSLNKAYPGPPRGLSETGIVFGPFQGGFAKKYIHLREIKDGKWSQVLHLLPGEYEFDLEYMEATPKTLTIIPIWDIATGIADLSSVRKAKIAFPVAAGMTYEIHLNRNSNIFYVSRRPTTEEEPKPDQIEPPGDAVACVDHADHSAEFWCEVRK